MSRQQRHTLIATILGSTVVFLDGTIVNVQCAGLQSGLPPAQSRRRQDGRRSKEQPLAVPDTSELRPAERPRVDAAATGAATSAFHLGAGLAGLLIIAGGVASGFGIENRERPKAAEEREKLGLAT